MEPDDLAARLVARADALDWPDGPCPLGLAGLSSFIARGPTQLTHQVYLPTFCLVLQGRKELRSGERSLSFGRMQTLMVGVDLAVTSRVTEAARRAPYVALALVPDMAMVRELAATVPAASSPDRATGPGFGTAEADKALLDAMNRLVSLLDRPRGREVLEPLVRREAHYWMLESAHGPMLRRLIREDGPSGRIAHAVAVIKRGFAAPLRVSDLAREAGMSASAFHAHFKAVTATTPVQFQKRLRLLEARRLIQAGGARVAAAAFAVGYESPTQFSRDYVRAFGRPPRAERHALALAAQRAAE